MDEHQLVVAVKNLALELGRTPTRREFESSVRGGAYQLTKFGSYTVLLQAAGLESNLPCKPKKIDNSVFVRDIERHLEDYRAKEDAKPVPAPQEKLVRGLFCGDIHFPFSNDKLIEKAVRFAEKEQPSIIVQGGDLYDFLSHGRFARSHNTFTPRQEQELARKKAETFWAEMRKACPDARLVQLWGNHDARPLRKILEVYPEAEDWVGEMVRKMMTFDGVETVEDYRQELFLPGNVMVHHGYLSQLGRHRDYTQMNAIVHHTHTGGVVFRKIRGQTLWELNAGYMADPHAKGLTYTPQRITHWTEGFGWTDEYGARFIPG